jgi:putative sporulation protein YtaF
MHLFYILFIALANNVDNISIRIAYSIKGLKISVLKNLWISIITFFISSFAAFFGTKVSKVFNSNVTPLISLILLVGIGLWFILEPNMKKESSFDLSTAETIPAMAAPSLKQIPDMRANNELNFREATYLGIALSINNIGGGLSAGMIGLNSFLVGSFSALISFTALLLGNYLTEIFYKLDLGEKVNIIAGIILILIGIKQVL